MESSDRASRYESIIAQLADQLAADDRADGILALEFQLEWVGAALANSINYLEDAQVLLDAGRPTRAFVFAVMAIEEAGKAGKVATFDERGTAALLRLATDLRFGGHQPKLHPLVRHVAHESREDSAIMRALAKGGVNDALWRALLDELAHELAKTLHTDRMSAMYVDLIKTDDGLEVVRPKVDQAVVMDILTRYGDVIRNLHDDFDAARQRLREEWPNA